MWTASAAPVPVPWDEREESYLDLRSTLARQNAEENEQDLCHLDNQASSKASLDHLDTPRNVRNIRRQSASVGSFMCLRMPMVQVASICQGQGRCPASHTSSPGRLFVYGNGRIGFLWLLRGDFAASLTDYTRLDTFP